MYFYIILFYFTKSKESGIYPSSDWFKYHIHPSFCLACDHGLSIIFTLVFVLPVTWYCFSRGRSDDINNVVFVIRSVSPFHTN